MSKQQAKVGDTIMVDPHNEDIREIYKGKELVVQKVSEDGDIKVTYDYTTLILSTGEYSIVSKKRNINLDCPECKGAGKILLFHFDSPCSLCNSTLDDDVEVTKDTECPQDFPENSHLKNAWYSKSAASRHGCVTYLHAKTGKEVNITEISSKSKPCGKWTDFVFVGIIDKDKYVRGSLSF